MNTKGIAKALILLLLLPFCSTTAFAQSPKDEAKMAERLQHYFAKYKSKGQQFTEQPRMLSYVVDNEKHTLDITADEYFAAQEFTPKITADIYKHISKELPKPYNKYKITIIANGMTIDDLVPNRLSQNADKNRMWGDIDYHGEPWVRNVSQPTKITHGLQNRHISLWASHGRYYDQKKGYWKWQRPNLFCTTEDLYTQTIVVPYLIPMLENAGAIVFTPRERDWQKQEIIVDNDNTHHENQYKEVSTRYKWYTTGTNGFAIHSGCYYDNENPFTAGTARMTEATNKKSGYNMISYQPDFPEDGRYAVYVSYQTMAKSICDAHYTVWHKGEKTEFRVNQQMGGSTWVYLGTFNFDKGSSEYNRVVLTNQSEHSGVVTADAVRFGGGMGNISREGSVSKLPRCLEGARYYAQWAGMPYSVYSSKNGQDDYADDINVRSFMTNYLGGGSVYMPTLQGLHVPIELSLAIHSDAGYARDGSSIFGPLAICTTNFNDGKLNSGISRMASRDLADALLSNEVLDIKYKYGRWNRRELFDRNYSETRCPEVPSAILETMSHQSFPDMKMGQDPNFRFTLARSIYKTLLRYINDQHGTPFVITPLTPNNLHISFTGKSEITFTWSAVNDPQESTSKPTSYIVYTAMGESDFDNGTQVNGTNFKMKLEPHVVYSFRVAAVNRGGCSFPSEILSACYEPSARQTVMVVNGFHRLSSPAVRDNGIEQGFDLDKDAGVSYGLTAGWAGRQVDFDRQRMGIEGSGGLGWGGNELAGQFVAGNTFSYVRTHADAIATASQYNIVSCSGEAVETGKVDLTHYAMTDLILGLEKNDGHSLVYYKTFSTSMQEALQRYTVRGGRLLVSGSYIGSDMTADDEQRFLSDVLKCSFAGTNYSESSTVSGMGTTIDYHHTLNEQHYAATHPEILQPTGAAYSVLLYDDRTSAGTAYSGNDYRVLTMGFPFECIKNEQKRANIMRGILNFLIK